MTYILSESNYFRGRNLLRMSFSSAAFGGVFALLVLLTAVFFGDTGTFRAALGFLAAVSGFLEAAPLRLVVVALDGRVAFGDLAAVG